MGIDISVQFENLRRGSNGNVLGKVTIRLRGSAFGQQFDVPVDARNFDFAQGGEQNIYDQDFGVKSLNAKLTAAVHERTAGRCCIQGHVHLTGPVGGGIGKDLDPNCQQIP